MKSTKEIGDGGEDLAVDYLVGQGYKIIKRNYRTRYGEIDIIALEGDNLSFIEVKKKSGEGFGSPGEMITPRKISKIRRTAESFINENNLSNLVWRIDAVLIDGERVELIRNITL